MKILEWLEINAEKINSDIDGDSGEFWVTKNRGDYITRVGMEDSERYLMKFGITDHVCSSWEAGKTVNIGFNPEEQKWYGWSHRAIYGFGVGDKCEKGQCHYRPVDKNDFLDDMVRFWSDEDKANVTGEHRDKGVYVEWIYTQSVPNEGMRDQISGVLNEYPEEYGRGEWTAETLADARQMAIDFASGVS